MLRTHLIRQQHNLYAHKIAALSPIITEIARRMVDRLDYIKLAPQCILDIGSGLGIDTMLLKQCFPQALILQLDSAIALLRQARSSVNSTSNSYSICADVLSLPCATASMNLIWSNLCLPYVDDWQNYFREIKRVLAVGDCFLVSGFGPDTFRQLREIGLSTYNFPDMHVIGDLLLKLGFSNPVTDVERITLEYENWQTLIADIRLIGCGAAVSNQHWLGRDDYNKLVDKFTHKIDRQKIPLTLEIFYAHAWKDDANMLLPDGEHIIHFQH